MTEQLMAVRLQPVHFAGIVVIYVHFHCINVHALRDSTAAVTMTTSSQQRYDNTHVEFSVHTVGKHC
jgi:hypothetical protein